MAVLSCAHFEHLPERFALDAPDHFRGCVGLQNRRAQVIVEVPGDLAGGRGDLGDGLAGEPDVLVGDRRCGVGSELAFGQQVELGRVEENRRCGSPLVVVGEGRRLRVASERNAGRGVPVARGAERTSASRAA
jgi:hypothetical protein